MLHASRAFVFKYFHNPEIPENEKDLVTTGRSNSYQGLKGSDIAVITENRSRPGKPPQPGRDKIRYKSIKASNAAKFKNPWTIWTKMYSIVYNMKYAAAMCESQCKNLYTEAMNDPINFNWPRPRDWGTERGGQHRWNGNQNVINVTPRLTIPGFPDVARYYPQEFGFPERDEEGEPLDIQDDWADQIIQFLDDDDVNNDDYGGFENMSGGEEEEKMEVIRDPPIQQHEPVRAIDPEDPPPIQPPPIARPQGKVAAMQARQNPPQVEDNVERLQNHDLMLNLPPRGQTNELKNSDNQQRFIIQIVNHIQNIVNSVSRRDKYEISTSYTTDIVKSILQSNDFKNIFSQQFPDFRIKITQKTRKGTPPQINLNIVLTRK